MKKRVLSILPCLCMAVTLLPTATLAVDNYGVTVSGVQVTSTIILSALVSLFVWIFMEPMLRLLGASDKTISYASDYSLWTIVIGGVPTSVGMTMSHLLRSDGHSREASIGIGMGGILNIILDPLFMFVLLKPGNEVTGAAQATALSNFISLIYFGLVFSRLRNNSALSLSFKNPPPSMKLIGEVLSVGLPSALSSLLNCFANMVLNGLCAGYGDIPLAAIGVVKKIDMLPMNITVGICQGMMPLVAYNFSAQNYKRMRQAASYARIAGIAIGTVCLIYFLLFSEGIARLFIDEPETVRLSAHFLKPACLAVPFMICDFQIGYSYQAMGKGYHALMLTLFRQGLVNIPLMYLLNSLFAVEGLIWAQFGTDVIVVFVSVLLYKRTCKKLKM